jgi:hypothetical protein
MSWEISMKTDFPLPNSRQFPINRAPPHDSAISSVVEHILHTDGVAGSNPASRTIQKIVVKSTISAFHLIALWGKMRGKNKNPLFHKP